MSIQFLRRRWVLAVLAAFGALAGAVFYLSRPSPVERLRTYLSQDLRTLSEEEQFQFDQLIGRLAPEARVFCRRDRPTTWDSKAWGPYLTEQPHAYFLRSWYLWEVEDGRGRNHLVLFQGMPLLFIPGCSYARLFVFDGEGRRLAECEFHTGWRITIEDARWLKDSGHGFPCLLVFSRPSIHGGDIARQYYALLEDTFALVRLEDRAGEFVPVNYHNPNHTIGPAVPERTPEQWETALRSPDPAEVLRALVWLGGHHSDPPLRVEDLCVEQFEDATRVLAARSRPGVRSAVEGLTRSDDRWVRQAAQHAREAIRGGDR